MSQVGRQETASGVRFEDWVNIVGVRRGAVGVGPGHSEATFESNFQDLSISAEAIACCRSRAHNSAVGKGDYFNPAVGDGT